MLLLVFPSFFVGVSRSSRFSRATRLLAFLLGPFLLGVLGPVRVVCGLPRSPGEGLVLLLFPFLLPFVSPLALADKAYCHFRAHKIGAILSKKYTWSLPVSQSRSLPPEPPSFAFVPLLSFPRPQCFVLLPPYPVSASSHLNLASNQQLVVVRRARQNSSSGPLDLASSRPASEGTPTPGPFLAPLPKLHLSK